MATKRAHPLEEYLPAELVLWLKANQAEAITPNRPAAGFNELRMAWWGLDPWEPVIPLIEPWITTQTQIQIAAQGAYERLLAVEPLRTEDGNLAGWFPTWWAETLLSKPWDERLGDAVIEATAYYLARLP